MSGETLPKRAEPSKRVRILLLVLGIFLGQIVLYGPSLTGQRILLPLDILAGKGFYLPQTPEYSNMVAKDPSLSDLVLMFEPVRRFAVSEFRAGRWPSWAPFEYAGAPFIALPPLSPFTAIQCSTESPAAIAWSQLFLALVAGCGAYAFLRLVLRLSFWPAVVGGWCFPLTGFFVFWEGFNLSPAFAWLPWLLLAVEQTVRGKSAFAPLGLALATCLVLNTQLDVAGQVLLVSGLYGLWRTLEICAEPTVKGSAEGLLRGPWGWLHPPPRHEPAPPGCGVSDCASPLALSAETSGSKAPEGWRSPKRWRDRFRAMVSRARGPVARLAAGWALGLLLGAPYILPVLDYTKTGSRMVQRAGGKEERPPVGLSALPQVILPDMYGTPQPPSIRYAGGPTQQESSAAGYAGLLAALVAAPMAFCSRRHRRFNLLWLGLAFLGLSWTLNVPLMVSLLRLPGLRMMSHNRLVFVDCFAIIALAATGLESLLAGEVRWQKWMWAPLGLLLALCGWCAFRSMQPPAVMARIAAQVSAGRPAAWIHDLKGVQAARASFLAYFAAGAVICGLGAVLWVLLRDARLSRQRLAVALAVLQIAELLWFAYGRNVQCSPELYYPPQAVLQALATAPPGRIMGFGCLPADLSAICGLRDIRGYDAVDPARLVELLMSAGDPLSVKPEYALTMELAPQATITAAGDIQLPPVLDMLGVRYVIFRGAPFPHTRPVLEGLDYWVLVNPRALPRAFVPQRVELLTNDAVRLSKMTSPEFNPRAVAYVETKVALPSACAGTAEIVQEVPTRVVVSAKMQTAGLLVLADRWDKGWRAYLDGAAAPVLRTNHAIRGVVVPAGLHKIEWRYEPQSFRWGLILALGSAVVLLGWTGLIVRRLNLRKEF